MVGTALSEDHWDCATVGEMMPRSCDLKRARFGFRCCVSLATSRRGYVTPSNGSIVRATPNDFTLASVQLLQTTVAKSKFARRRCTVARARLQYENINRGIFGREKVYHFRRLCLKNAESLNDAEASWLQSQSSRGYLQSSLWRDGNDMTAPLTAP